MQVSPQPSGGLGVGAARRPVRREYRHEIHKLLYVNIDHSNGGIIRNLSEAGAGLQAVTPLLAGQNVRLRFELLQPRVRVETSARVCWASASGQAGVAFSPLPERSHQSVQDWLLMQLLARAEPLFGKESVLQFPQNSVPGLTVSGTARDPVSLLINPSYRPDSFGLRIKESPRLLSAMVDGLVLAIAVLLFTVIAVGIIHNVPRGTVSAAVLLAVSAIFYGLYWSFSRYWMGMTLGKKLVQDALQEDELDTLSSQPAQPRFR
jgi:PilZ domain/RDD family